MVPLVDDRVQSAIVAPLNDIIAPQVEVVVRSKQYGSRRQQKRLVVSIDV